MAALSVFVYHAWLYTRTPVYAGNRTSLGSDLFCELRVGLVLFFVLSGFLLYSRWVRAAYEGSSTPAVQHYAVRRAGRILPAYWVALIGSVVLLWGLDGHPGVRLPEAHQLWLFVLFGQNFNQGTLLTLDGPMWTLAVEASFYAVLPVLGWLAVRGGKRVGAIAVPVALLAGGVAFNWWMAQAPQASSITTKVLPSIAPYFALGMLAAALLHARRVPRWLPAALFVVGATLIVGDGWWWLWNAHAGNPMSTARRIWQDTLSAAGFACVVAGAVAARRPVRILVARPVVWLGDVSYGFYLWHVPVLLVLRAFGLLPLEPFLAVVVALPLCLLVAAASWRWVEQPGLRWARRASARRSAGGQAEGEPARDARGERLPEVVGV